WESLLDYPAKLRLNRRKNRGRNRRILPLEPKFFSKFRALLLKLFSVSRVNYLAKGTISTTKTLL
ncbi:MAG: hypothetical protein DMF32_12605, partial [Verrucomicrobia bacterium]